MRPQDCALRVPPYTFGMRRTSYEQMNCSIASALDVVGEPWTLLIVRDAFYGVRRFDVMYNDFVLVGPQSDPAKVKGGKDIAAALKSIAAAKAAMPWAIMFIGTILRFSLRNVSAECVDICLYSFFYSV